MVILAFVLIALAVPIASCMSIGGDYYMKPNDTQTCVNDLVAWCDGMKFPADKGSVSVVSVTMIDSSGYCQAVCVADSEGANCTKKGLSWLNCTNTNQLFYKENALTKDSLEGTDNATCEAADKAFNDLSVQGLNFDNSAKKRDLFGGFFSELERKFLEIFGGGGGFPFNNNNPDTPSSSGGDTNIPPVQDDLERE